MVLAGVAVGMLAEGAAFEWSEVGRWVPDLAVGLTLIGAGASVVQRRPGTGILLAAVGFTWFAGNFAPSLLYLHRGPLVQLLVTYPGWRPRSRLEIATVTSGYVAAVVAPVWREDVTAVVLAAGLVAVCALRVRLATGRARRDRRISLSAAAAFGITVGAGTVVRLVVPSGDAVEPVLVVYEAVLCWIAIMLTAQLRPPPTSSLADLVVELGETRSGTLRDALAATLDDPTLEVGYWTRPDVYIDPAGRPIAVPAADDERATTYVQRDSRPFAVLVHDASVLDEPGLVEAVAAATRLSAANAALDDEVRAQVSELEASRRRLVLAADEERRRLDLRVRAGVEQRVQALIDLLRGVPERTETRSAEHVRRAERHLAGTVADLHELAEGLHPRDLDDGLRPALVALAGRCPVPVELRVEPRVDLAGSRPAEVDSAVYYVCAEALSNIAKHAKATRVVVRLSEAASTLTVVVADDGAGGADPMHGFGLRGLVDRVEALGGTLTVTSPSQRGTRLTAELPLDRQPPQPPRVSRSS